MTWTQRQDLQFALDGTGAFQSWVVKGKTLPMKTEGQLPLLELALRKDTERIVVTPERFTAEWDGHRARWKFDRCRSESGETFPIAGRLTLDVEDDGAVTWGLKLENASELPVCEVLYPRLPQIYVSPEVELMYPHHAGECIVNVPAALASEKYQQFWRAGSKATDFGFEREINYCGLASMTYMDLSDGDYGIYVASHDPSFPVTGLRIETGGPEDPWVSLSFRKYVDIDPGQAYESAPIVWAFHSGDWHVSARRYRAWFDTIVEQAEHPADLSQEIVLSPHYNFRRYEGIEHTFAHIPEMSDRDFDEFGSRHFFMAGWNHMGFDSHYPNYNPDLELGTPMALKRGVDYINSKGRFVTFYINARIMDKYSEYADTLGERMMLRTLDQKPIYEVYGPAETFVLCPSNPEWRQMLEDFAVWMVQAYGARGIYYDQLGSATPYPCYSDHEHGPVVGTSGFNQGYIDLIERTTKKIREIREDSFLMIENCGDIYSSRLWGSLAWNGTDYDEFFNLYKYTFPEHTLVNMIAPRVMADHNPKKQEQMFMADLVRAYVLGSVFWFEGEVFRKRVQDKTRLESMLGRLREALQVRKAVQKYIGTGTFQDDLGLQVHAGVTATRWQAGDGSTILLVANETGSASELKVKLDAEELALHVFDSTTLTWEARKAEVVDGDVVIEVPPALFSAVRLHVEGSE